MDRKVKRIYDKAAFAGLSDQDKKAIKNLLNFKRRYKKVKGLA